MPDMERVLRSLELHVAETEVERAFVRGHQAGEDKARWQVLRVIVVLALIALVLQVT